LLYLFMEVTALDADGFSRLGDITETPRIFAAVTKV